MPGIVLRAARILKGEKERHRTYWDRSKILVKIEKKQNKK